VISTGHNANTARKPKTGFGAVRRSSCVASIGPSRSRACIEQPSSSGFTRVKPSWSFLPRSKPALFSLFGLVLACLAFTVAPAAALAVGPEKPVTSSPAGSITGTSAIFEGTLNPHSATKVGGYFAYSGPGGLTCAEGPVVGLEGFEGEKAEEAIPVHAKVGLEPGRTYKFCLVATNELGEVTPGEEVSVKTPLIAPTIESESVVRPVKAGEVRLEGVVNANNETTECKFEYGTESSLKAPAIASCEPGALVGVFGGQPVALNVGGLVAHTKYYYRVIAENEQSRKEGKPSEGPIEEFETATPPETPEVINPESISGTEEVLKGVVNSNAPGNHGSYQFVYQQSTSECERYNEKQEVFEIVNETEPKTSLGEAQEAVEAPVEKLLPGTTYTFCLLAHNEAGEESALSAPETFTTPAEAPMISGEYVTKVQFRAATLNAQIDPKGAKTSYFFEYGTTKTYGTSTTESVLEGSLTVTDPATATIAGLQPGTTYHYRVVAASEVKPGKIEDFDGSDATFTTPAEPGSTSESCPNAQARTEQPYGQALPDCRAYELVSPLYKNDRGVEAVDSRASASVSGEDPAIAYQATGSFSEAGAPEPQGAEKVNRYISRRGAAGWSTRNVQPLGVAYESGKHGDGAFEELLFTPDLSTGLLSSEDVALVGGEPEGYVNLYLADLASSPVSYQTVSNVTPPNDKPYAEGEERPHTAGISTDLSHVVFQQRANLTSNAEGTATHVYEWAAGKLSQVDISPAGTQFKFADQVGAPGEFIPYGDQWHAVSANGLRVFFTADEPPSEETGQLYVRENPEQEPSLLNKNGECMEPAKACTVAVSASQKTNGTGPEVTQPAYFRDANAEGTRVFFTSRAELTNDANTGSADNTANLYEYELSNEPGKPGKLTDLTAPTEVEAPNGAAVLGLVTASENAGEENSYVYFVANGVLASNENSNKETAKRGNCKENEFDIPAGEPTCSLYVAHYNGGKWKTTFIATLSGHPTGQRTPRNDETDWVGFEGGGLNDDKGPGSHTARVTPDGTTLAFESERSLTGYDNDPVEPGVCTELGGRLNANDPAVPCREVYLYEAVTGRISCVSCDPSGARPSGPAELGGQEEEEGNIDADPSTFYLSRNLSEDGKRLFFQSPDPLVSHDNNGKLDVYEWEQLASPAEIEKAENSCTSSAPTFSASGGGCVFPISDVAGNFESKFMDASPNGSDVFIATKDQLVPEADADSRANVYDVRVSGGFPVSVAPPPCDNGDSCKPPVSPQPQVFAASGSATFSGLGNPVPTVAPPPPKKATTKTVKCKKRKKREHGKCVRVKSNKKSKRAKAKRAGNNGRASS
jgi:hypothetical protein